jgi:putative acetyltransferase
MRSGLEGLRGLGSNGCVVVCDANYQAYFGFRSTSEMFVPGVPPEIFMAPFFGGTMPQGELKFDKAFDAHGSAVVVRNFRYFETTP